MVVSVYNERVIWIGLWSTAGGTSDLMDSECNVPTVLVTRFDSVFHEETVAVNVVQHNILDQNIVRAVNRQAAIV